MLKTRNLDDQTYAEIVSAAEDRLPWLCPRWTNYNASDPGITIVELMAWYKELQQYHMNQMTDALRRKLLKLAGAFARPAVPARCAVEIDSSAPARPAGGRLYTREGIPFELAEAVPARRPVLERVYVARGDRRMDVVGVVRERRITFQPFDSDGEERGVLYIGFSALGEGALRLWFDVDPPPGVARNPFADEKQVPRVIRWRCQGAAGTDVLRDETHALSVSGYVYLAPQGDWPAGEGGLHWLTLTLEDPGCEENVRLSGISARRYEAVQRETLASSRRFRAEARPDWSVELEDARAADSRLAVFLRTAQGWERAGQWEASAGGWRLRVDARAAEQDGQDNIMAVCLDNSHMGGLAFDAKGLPGETFFLGLEGRTALSEQFTLLCNTLHRDGQVRPALWRCVDDLYRYGPRDRVFTYDPARETITFGDGEHGALLQRGEGAVLAAELTVSYCGGGNIPGGMNLRFDGEKTPVRNTAACGGADRETAAETQARLLRELSETRKCVSAEDYERLAKRTPGLRVALAKAIPAYDPDEPTGVSWVPIVTVVVAPAGADERPAPDGGFLQAVREQLERGRPIGTSVKVAPPVYVDIDVTVSLRGGRKGVEQEIDRAMREYLAGERVGVGGTVRAGDALALIQAAPGVSRVGRVTLRSPDPGCHQSADGDIALPKRGIPRLRQLKVERLPVER